MKQQIKSRALALLLVVCMVAGMMPAAHAATAADTLYVSNAGTDTNDGTDPLSPLATIGAAYNAINDGGTIILQSDLDVRAAATFGQSKAVTIDGQGNTITYTSAATLDPDRAGVFIVTAGTLKLTNITVQMPRQRGANGRALYVGAGGAVVLQDGATLANGYLGYGGGVAKVDGGTLTMEDGAAITGGYIVNNTTAYGGGVLVAAGTFTMAGGTVSGNTIHTTQGYDNYGGGVAVMAGATFTMTGGDIGGNTVDTSGGGVYLAPGGILELSGPATITGNTAAGADNNLYLPTTGATFEQTAPATGTVGVTHGEADYNVIVGIPSGYTIAATDEAAYTYDTGAYDIRLKNGNLVLYYWTVGVEINGSGFDSSFTDNETIKGQDFDTTLTPDEGVRLPEDITVTVGGEELGKGDYTYDPDTGTVHIPGAGVTDDIVITVTPDALYTVTVEVEHVTASSAQVIVIQRDTTEICFTAVDRYALPADVTITGPCDHVYDAATGKLTISNVAGDVTVNATGAEIPHDIHLDPAGGAVDPATVTINESQPTIGILPTPQRTGYTFTGWFTASGDRVAASTPNYLTADLYLTAHWSADTNIRYQVQQWVERVDSGANPGYVAGTTITQQMEHMGVTRTYYLHSAQDYNNGISNGHKDITPLALAKLVGLDLQGLTPSGANVYSVTMASDGSSVFPLFYDRNPYKIIFDPNGGTIAQGDAVASIRYGSLYGILPSATRTGYVLDGWYTDSTGGVQVVGTDVYLQTANQTLYAHWATTGDTAYTVTHMTQNLKDNLVSYDKTPDAYSVHLVDHLTGAANSTVDVYALALAGYTLSPENVYSVYIQANGTGNVTLYYDRMVTAISYDGNGGTLAAPGMRTLIYYGGTVSSLAAAPSRNGYDFVGWYLAPGEAARRVTVGMAVADVDPVGGQTVTLYAHWSKQTPPMPPSDGGGGGGSVTPPKPLQETGKHIAYIKGYPNGNVGPLNNILRCEAATIFYRLLDAETRTKYEAQVAGYSDIRAGSWYSAAVATLSKMGVITGRPNGTFAPMDPITRGEFAAMAARFAEAVKVKGSTDIQGMTFNDITGHWARNYITKAAALGWVKGDGTGAYRPEANMTRAETVTLVNRVFNRGVTVAGMLPGMVTFPDNTAGAWYYEDIQEAANGHSYTRTEGTGESWSALLP